MCYADVFMYVKYVCKKFWLEQGCIAHYSMSKLCNFCTFNKDLPVHQFFPKLPEKRLHKMIPANGWLSFCLLCHSLCWGADRRRRGSTGSTGEVLDAILILNSSLCIVIFTRTKIYKKIQDTNKPFALISDQLTCWLTES